MPYRDPERRRAYGREWIKRHPEKAREAMRRWRNRHPADHSQDSRAYYARHRERLARYFAEFQRTHPELRRHLSARRRARKLEAAGSFTVGEWLALLELWDGRCAYCGERAPLEIDHRVPLARGGTNSIDNILPACGPCNRRKHAMWEEEFRARLAAENMTRDRSPRLDGPRSDPPAPSENA
jgi:5-methylcytosine-specific restriction endonuclease McrA